MTKNLFIIAVMLTGLIACKSKAAYNYSQDIVSKERSLSSQIEITEDNVVKYVAAEQFDSVAIAGEKMETLVQQKIDEIEAMSVPKAKEAANFKASALRYFKYIKSLYTGYKNLGNAPTEEARQEVVADLKKLINEKQTVISEMQRNQEKFADANGFKVQ